MSSQPTVYYFVFIESKADIDAEKAFNQETKSNKSTTLIIIIIGVCSGVAGIAIVALVISKRAT